MNTNFKYLLTAFILLFTMAACDEEMTKDTELAEGSLELSSMNFKLEVNTEEVLVTKAGTDIDKYIIRILNESGAQVESFVYTQMPEIITLKVGNYTIEAHSQELSYESTSSEPYYYGSTNFSIVENKVTTIDKIKCSFQSVKVEVILHEDLLGKLDPGYSTKVTMGNITHTFNASSTSNHTYFPAQEDSQKNILMVLLEGAIEGVDLNEPPKSYAGVKAGEYRRITFNLQSNGVDDNEEWLSGNLSMKVDATCKIITKDIDITVKEDIIDPNGPGTTDPEPDPDPTITIVARGFDIKDPQLIPLDDKGLTVIIDMVAENGIQHLYVKIESDVLTTDILTGINLATEFDLVNPGRFEEGLSGIGFPVGDEIYGKTNLVFDISEFTSLINELDEVGGGLNKFILTIVDFDNVSFSETLTLISQ